MERFVTRHRNRIVGILSGFDRMLFRAFAVTAGALVKSGTAD
jgi:hypothetical protein